MSVTVSAQPANWPPRNEVTVTVPAGNVMKTASLSRVINGVSTLTRTQPSTGLDTRVVEDYECTYGVSATYRFIADYIDPTAFTTVWSEAWADVSAWTGDAANFAVASGKVIGPTGPGTTSHTISRPVATGSYRVTIASIADTYFVSGFISFGSLVKLEATTAGLLVVATATATTTTAISSASPITVDFLGTSIVISGTGGTYTISGLASTDFSTVSIYAYAPSANTFSVGAVTVSAYGAATHTDVTSSPVTLSPSVPWIIHPSNPGLSMPISSNDRSQASIRTIGDVTNPSASTLHTILGQSQPITTTSGPRFSNQLTVMIATKTRAQELALLALLNDGTPLLIQSPPSFDIGFDEGFYSVGDVIRSRQAQKPGNHWRDFTLPLTQVQAPIVGVQNTGWSWAALAAEFPTWADVSNAYATWADVLIDNRRPGF